MSTPPPSPTRPRLVCFVNDIYDESIAGGDIYFYFTASAAIAAGYPIHFFGGHALVKYLERWRLPKNLTLTDSGPGRLGDVSKLPGQFRLLFDFGRRMIGSFRRLKEIQPDDIAYSMSDFWFDAIPLIHCQARRKILDVGMMAPTFRQVLFRQRADVTALRLTSFYFWLSHQISLRWFRRCAGGIVTYCHPDIKNYLLGFGYRESDLWYVPNGSDAVTSGRISLQPKEFDVAWTGRVHPQKGIDDLLGTFAWLKQQMPDFKAIVIGNSKKWLEPVCQQMGLSENVTFSGLVSEEEKFRLLKSSRLFLMPSRYESWGIVVAEALVSGVPVLAYKLDCYPAVFGDFVRYVTPFDSDAFKRAAEDEVRKQRAGQNYLASMDWPAMREKLSWETTQKSFCSLLETLSEKTL
ncbi:MAG TPA: glycosyltransferase family 4 protein [Verrucomicrobiae bacterium]|nr:glycosyltransferase family 4 protein [Verrucomicrobiae bacterium]